MRLALPLSFLLATCTAALAQPAGEPETKYLRDAKIRIPFIVKAGGGARSIKLFYNFEGGAWQQGESARPSQKDFLFTADRDGAYSFATMTVYDDGTSEPARKDQLVEQKRVVVDRKPPKILSLRSVVSADGAPGIEWDVTDENLGPRAISIEYRWPDMQRFAAIDKGVPFAARDHRSWVIPPNQRMQVRIVAVDKAGNTTESDPVWVSARDGAKGGDGLPRPAVNGVSGVRPTDGAGANTGRTQPPITYVNSRTVTLNSNAVVGPSGLTAAILYVADDKLVWT